MENKIESPKIKSFTDLNAWKEAHKLALLIYRYTEDFPINEKYSLIDQMRSAAVSISSNIAEGFSRQSKKEKLQFYYIAKGSLTELQNQLLLSKDVGYIKKEAFNQMAEQTIVVDKLIMGLIKSIKAPINPLYFLPYTLYLYYIPGMPKPPIMGFISSAATF